MTATALVFGASGAIGGAIVNRLANDGYEVWQAGRTAGAEKTILIDSGHPATYANVENVPQLSAVVWAQGVNHNDSITDIESRHLRGVLEANTLMVLDSMHALLSAKRLLVGARCCIVSSVWQVVTRRNKLSYTVSKAALDGVVRSTAADLAADGILVNAVLPGVIDTPMTRSVLSAEEIEAFERANGFGRLISLDDVANTVSFLCSPRNTGITGQSIVVDLGFAHERNL